MSPKVEFRCLHCNEPFAIDVSIETPIQAGYATERQKNYIKGLCERRGIPVPEGIDNITIGEASALIATLKRNTE